MIGNIQQRIAPGENSSAPRELRWWRTGLRFEHWWRQDLFDHGSELSRHRERSGARIRVNGPARLAGFVFRAIAGWLAVTVTLAVFAAWHALSPLLGTDARKGSVGPRGLVFSAALGVVAWWGLRRFALTTKRIERSVLNRLVLALLHIDDSFRWSPPTIPETAVSLPAVEGGSGKRALRRFLLVAITLVRLCLFFARLPVQVLLKVGLVGTRSGLAKDARIRALSALILGTITAALLWAYRPGDSPRGRPAEALIATLRSFESAVSGGERHQLGNATRHLAEISAVYALVLVSILSIAEQLRMVTSTRKLIRTAPRLPPLPWRKHGRLRERGNGTSPVSETRILHWSDLHLCRAEQGDDALRVEVAYEKRLRDVLGISKATKWMAQLMRTPQTDSSEEFCGGNRRFRLWCETHANAIAESHAIVLSGDLTDTGAVAEFEAFQAIAASPHLKMNLVVCPGNHDLNFSANSVFVVEASGRVARTLRCLRMLSFLADLQGARTSVLDGERLVNLQAWVNGRIRRERFERLLERLEAGHFRGKDGRASVYACAREVQSIYESAFPLVVEAESANGIRFLVFDSVDKASSFVTNAYGHVPGRALSRGRRIRRLLGDVPLVTVLHHHLILLNDAPAPKAAMMLVDNADEVLSFLREGPGQQLVLHGHKHVGQKLELCDAPITIVSAPSTSLGDEGGVGSRSGAEQLVVEFSKDLGVLLVGSRSLVLGTEVNGAEGDSSMGFEASP